MEKEKIKFKPLHEGMGFHPFSDGLPYAPESKTKYSNGSGATSAGRPHFATSIPVVKQTAQARTARQIQELQQKVEVKSAPVSSPIAPIKETPVTKTAPTQKAIKEELSSSPSLLRKRTFAYVMDSVIHAGFWLATNLAAFFFFQFQIDSEILRDNLGAFFLFFIASQWIFIALQEILFGNSLGKVFFNLEFKRNHRSLFLRSFVFMLGLLCFGLGLIYRPQDRLGEIQSKSTSAKSL